MEGEQIQVPQMAAKMQKKMFERIDFTINKVLTANIINNAKVQKGSIYLLSKEESLGIMIETPKGSRVTRPTFGSLFYTLVDRDFNDIWILKAKKMILECIYDQNDVLWDKRVDIKNLDITLDMFDKAQISIQLW